MSALVLRPPKLPPTPTRTASLVAYLHAVLEGVISRRQANNLKYHTIKLEQIERKSRKKGLSTLQTDSNRIEIKYSIVQASGATEDGGETLCLGSGCNVCSIDRETQLGGAVEAIRRSNYAKGGKNAFRRGGLIGSRAERQFPDDKKPLALLYRFVMWVCQ